jgi:hypothetical protein
MATHAFSEEPDAIADVASLVVMDLRIALDEAGKKRFALQVLGGESKRRQTERALEDEVVDRYEADLRGEVRGCSDQVLVSLAQCFVEDLLERADVACREPNLGLLSRSASGTVSQLRPSQK